MNILLQSLPKRGKELINKGAPALIKFFSTDADVLYLYGPTGSGKTTGIEILAKEYAYEILKTEPPFDRDKVSALCAKGIFMLNRKLVLIEEADRLSSEDIKNLSRGYWDDSKLVMIGSEYPKKSPIRKYFKTDDYRFMSVKFAPFTKDDIMGCLSLYGIELGVHLSYELLNKIAEYADGDMRAARMSLRNVIASEDEDSVDVFLPFSDRTFRHDVEKLFSDDKVAIRDAVLSLSPYITIMIIKENLIKFCPDKENFFELLHSYANLDVDYTEDLVNLAYAVGRDKRMQAYKYVWYRKPSVIQPPNVDVDCSDAKKIVYYKGLERGLNMI